MPACGRGAPPGERVATHQAAVGNGTTDAYGKYNSVVQVDIDPGVFGVPAGELSACSGTLVTPYYVLTANHCVTGKLREGLGCIVAKGTPISNLSLHAQVDFFHESDKSGTFYQLSPTKSVEHTTAKSG